MLQAATLVIALWLWSNNGAMGVKLLRFWLCLGYLCACACMHVQCSVVLLLSDGCKSCMPLGFPVLQVVSLVYEQHRPSCIPCIPPAFARSIHQWHCVNNYREYRQWIHWHTVHHGVCGANALHPMHPPKALHELSLGLQAVDSLAHMSIMGSVVPMRLHPMHPPKASHEPSRRIIIIRQYIH